MAMAGVTVVVISSSSSSSSEDEEEEYERSQKLKLRRQFLLLERPRRGSGGRGDGDDDDDDCVILEKDPFSDGEAEVARAIADLPGKLSLSLRGREGRKDGSFRQQPQHQNAEGEEESEISILAERGKVALRDYPHSRYLCAKYPFSKTPHEKYCEQLDCSATAMYVINLPHAGSGRRHQERIAMQLIKTNCGRH